MNEQLMKTSGADVLSSGKKTQKSLMGGGGGDSPPPPLYVRGLSCAVAASKKNR